LKTPVISPPVVAIVADLVNSINQGTVTLTVQDGRLLQLERNDKIRLDTLGKSSVSSVPLTPNQVERLQKKLQDELKNLQFGQVLLHIKGGVIAQIERTEKQRYSGLEGIYGDGI